MKVGIGKKKKKKKRKDRNPSILLATYWNFSLNFLQFEILFLQILANLGLFFFHEKSFEIIVFQAKILALKKIATNFFDL
jgi:hypothetical protein